MGMGAMVPTTSCLAGLAPYDAARLDNLKLAISAEHRSVIIALEQNAAHEFSGDHPVVWQLADHD